MDEVFKFPLLRKFDYLWIRDITKCNFIFEQAARFSAFIRCSLLSGAPLFKENTAFIERTTERESTTSFEGPLTWPLVWGVTHLPRPEAEGEVLERGLGMK